MEEGQKEFFEIPAACARKNVAVLSANREVTVYGPITPSVGLSHLVEISPSKRDSELVSDADGRSDGHRLSVHLTGPH